MPLFNKYSKDGKFLGAVQEPLSVSNIEQFFKEQGEEKARVYLEALAEFNKELEFCIFVQHSPINYNISRTTNICRKMTKKLFHDNQTVLSVYENILDTHAKKGPINLV